jgi:hypothetical protein
MHQKHPPAKIAVLDSAAELPSEPEAMTKAASKAAVSAAQIHLANMGVSSLSSRDPKDGADAGIVALARP